MKRIILYGAPGSGKTRMAMSIAEIYEKDEVVLISARGKEIFNPFLLSACTEKTKLIIFDDCLPDFAFEFFYDENLSVNKKGVNSFVISPEMLVFITTDKPMQTSSSFTMRFELIDCESL